MSKRGLTQCSHLKYSVAILRIRTLAAFANAFRVRPLNHSGRIAVRGNAILHFLTLLDLLVSCLRTLL